jgi:hypothetical protein
MKVKRSFWFMLKQQGFSEMAIEEIWKWYDFSEKKGVANY